MRRCLAIISMALLLLSIGCSETESSTQTTVDISIQTSTSATLSQSGTSSSTTSKGQIANTVPSSGATNRDQPVRELSLQAGEYRLVVTRQNEGWCLFISSKSGVVLYANDTPAIIKTVVSAANTAYTAATPYQSARLDDDHIICTATVSSALGSTFRVTDIYRVQGSAFLVDRTVTVVKTDNLEEGFASVYSLFDADGGDSSNYEYFIPSILYKDSTALNKNSLMSFISSQTYVKETRCGTPLAMLRGTADGYSLGLVHVNPSISVTNSQYQIADAIDNAQQYGSLGYTIRSGKVSVDYVYPSTETPKSYETGGAVRRFHNIDCATVQQYTLGILIANTPLYNEAMVNTYLAAISLENPFIADIDPQDVYDANMELYEKLYVRYQNSSTGHHSSGLPFAVNVKNLKDFYHVSFQMGFIGCQPTIAAELIRDGYLTKNTNSTKLGKEMLDFWTADYVYTDSLPPSWWQPSNGGNAGASTGYPSFLRCFVDGAEGILNACLYAEKAGIDCRKWKAATVKIADFLVNHQNADGSYYRAYNTDGTVCTSNESAAYQGTSKLNTPVAVRFLCSMYDYTGDKKYYNAAVKAADYCYNELYLRLGKYIGGTPDNPNVPDKEAAIYALYAFSAVYDMTEDKKYYPALEHAAVSAMSWVYTYDFSIPFSTTSQYDSLNIFKKGNTAGWSVIATGHSSIDVFGVNAYYELFKQYLRCGNQGYLKIAGLLQNNTAKAMDLYGNWGYHYRGLCLEACNVADQVFYTAENGVWLPWISAAFMEPLIRTEETFGECDIYDLLRKNTREQLLAMTKQ